MSSNTKRKSKFPWDFESTELLIRIYGEHIDDFLNRFKKQITLWKLTVEEMKHDDALPAELKELLNDGIVQRRWFALQRDFKVLFHASLKIDAKPSIIDFPYYQQMYKIFMDYAKKKLDSSNELNDTMNQTTDANLTTYVKHLLGGEDLDLSGEIPNSTIDEDKENRENVDKKSAASRVRQKILQMPKDEVCVVRERLRVEPNTPFNRKYQLSTIVDSHNSGKRSLECDDIKPVVKKSRSIPLKRETRSSVSKLNPKIEKNVNAISKLLNDDFDSSSFLYEIEALEECDIEKVQRFSKSQKNRSSQSVITVPDLSDVQKTPDASELTVYEFIDETSQMSEANEPENSNNSMIIPPMEMSSIDLLRAVTSKPPACRDIEHTLTGSAPIVPRRLDMSRISLDNSSISEINMSTIVGSQEDGAPAWFRSFMAKYDSDMNLMKNRMGVMEAKLNKLLSKLS